MPAIANNATTAPLSPIGRSDLIVPSFSLGTGPLGELRSLVPEEVAQATLSAAWDGGVRFFDTAGWYGRGLAEHRLGTFLRGKERTDYVVTTKVGRTLHRPANPAGFDRSPWVGGLNFDVAFDFSYDGIMRSFDQALQRLVRPVAAEALLRVLVHQAADVVRVGRRVDAALLVEDA
ncbi:MAG: aldo/keto reductase, partial [Novosphingobium sp.]